MEHDSEKPTATVGADSPIALNAEQHIEAVSFLGKTQRNRITMPPFFEDAQDWTEIPKLTVLTGVNGSGKSSILTYLFYYAYAELEKHSKGSKQGKNQIVYIKSDVTLFQNRHRESSNGTSYEISTPDRMKELIDQCQVCLRNPSKLPSTNDYVKRICQKANHKGVDSRRELEEIARSIIVRNPADVHDPLPHLTHIITQYENRLEVIEKALDRSDKCYYLFKFYEENRSKFIGRNLFDTKDFETFAFYLEEFPDFKEIILKEAAKYNAGIFPFDVINEVLEKYNFKYRLRWRKSGRTSSEDKLKLIDTITEEEITVESLCSGERMILSVMSWLYYQIDETLQSQGLDYDHKIKILLLDEPDRHLDPKLAAQFFDIIKTELVDKHGVQVIMSTHRVDSVAVAPQEALFVIRTEDNKRLNIMPVSRMEAIFRMTSNIRGLTCYERRVYTESVTDAYFYEGVYRTLRDWYPKTKDGWYPSQRHTLAFHSVSNGPKGNNKKDGGSTKVLARIGEDNTVIDSRSGKGWTTFNSSLSKLVDEPELLKTFGILDSDYGATGKKAEEDGVISQIVILQRYAIENFCLDPLILCGVLTEEEIEHYIPTIFQGLYIDTKKTEDEIEQIKICNTNISKKLCEICLAINTAIKSQEYENVQENLTEYFIILLLVAAQRYHVIKFDTKQETIDKFNDIYKILDSSDGSDNSVKINKIFSNKDIHYEAYWDLLSKKGIKFTANEGKISHTFLYPKVFLEIRGHTLEGLLFKKKKKKKKEEEEKKKEEEEKKKEEEEKKKEEEKEENLVDKITQRIYYDGLPCIPQDLIDSFRSLDVMVRRSAHKATKPDWPCRFLDRESIYVSNTSSLNASRGDSIGIDARDFENLTLDNLERLWCLTNWKRKPCYGTDSDEFTHHHTVADGNCGFSALALGLLYFKKNKNEDLLSDTEFITQFALAFRLPEKELKAHFWDVINALLTYRINLDNHVISKIINRLSNIPNIVPGTEKNQINKKLCGYKEYFIDEQAYSDGNIKGEYRSDAIRCLAEHGILYQLVMAYVFREFFVLKNKEKVTYYQHYFISDDSKELGQDIKNENNYELSITQNFGEYLDEEIFAFFAVKFDLVINIEQSEFQSYNYTSKNERGEISFKIFVSNPNTDNPHFELVLPSKVAFLHGKLTNSYVLAPSPEKLAVHGNGQPEPTEVSPTTNKQELSSTATMLSKDLPTNGPEVQQIPVKEKSESQEEIVKPRRSNLYKDFQPFLGNKEKDDLMKIKNKQDLRKTH